MGGRNEQKEQASITHLARVDIAIDCEDEECGFQTTDYIEGIRQAEAHHRETGHDLYGQTNQAVWVGHMGMEKQQARVDALMRSMGLTS